MPYLERFFRERKILHLGHWPQSRAFHERSRRLMGAQQSFHALAQGSVAATGLLQKCRALLRGQIDGTIKYGSGLLLGLAQFVVQ